MRKRAVVHILLAMVLVSAAGCATMESAHHKYVMKGQILDVAGAEAYLCIGSAEGAKAGQEYTVYRFTRMQPAGPKQQPRYKREVVGAVKITEVVDEHYASAKVLRGELRANDVAELVP